VEVVDEHGLLLSGVDIRAIARATEERNSLTRREWNYSLATTMSDGRASVPTAGVSWVFATLEGRVSSLVAITDHLEETVQIVMPSARGTTVTVRKAAGEPAAGLVVLASPSAQFRVPPFHLTADAAGLLDPSLPLGSYTLGVPNAEARLGEARTDTLGRTAKRVLGLRSGHVRIEIAADDRTVLLRAERVDDGMVEVVDPTGAPIAPVEFWQETLGRSEGVDPQWGRLQQPGQIRVDGNRFSVDIFGDMRTLGDPGYRVVVAAPGYSRGILSHPIGPGRAIRVVLYRHDEQHYVRVVNGAGAPYEGRVRIREEGCPWPLVDAAPDPANGRLGPIIFNGPGRLELFRASGAEFLPCGTLPYRSFMEEEEPEIVVPGTASILIEGGRLDPRQYCAVGRDRRVWWGKQGGEGLLIDGLLPGRYVVTNLGGLDAIRRLVGDLSLNFTRRPVEEVLPIELREGERRHVQQPEMTPQYSYSGTVALPEGLSGQLYLYALAPGQALPRRAGMGVPRWSLAASGEYSLSGIQFKPAELVLARIDSVGWVMPLGSFSPGEDYSPDGAVVILDLEGLQQGLCQATVPWKGSTRFCYSLVHETEKANLGWLPRGDIEVLVIDHEDRYTSVHTCVTSTGVVTLELQADDDTRASSWKHAPQERPFDR